MKGLVRPTAKNNNQLTEIGMRTQANINETQTNNSHANHTGSQMCEVGGFTGAVSTNLVMVFSIIQ